MVLRYLFVLALLSAHQVWAAIYYFDPVGGSNSNNCLSEGAPCQTEERFNSLSATANPGDQFLWKRGTVRTTTASLRISGGRHGTEAAPIVIGAYGTGDPPVLSGAALPGGVQILTCTSTNWWMVQDLTLDGDGGKGAMEWKSCADHLFQRNTIRQCSQECVRVRRNSVGEAGQRITIRQNRFATTSATERIYIGTDPAQASGVPDPTSDILIEDNEMTGTATAECIEIKQGAHHVTIRRNYIHDTGVGNQNGCIFATRADAATLPGEHIIAHNWLENISGAQGYPVRIRNHATITGNLIRGAEGSGILLEQPSTNPLHVRTVTYNTIVDNTGACLTSAGEGNTIAHNICWGNGSENDASDPLFVDAGVGNYRLQAGSPALTRGALRPFNLTTPAIQVDGATLVVETNPPSAPLQSCASSPGAFTVTCPTAGVLTTENCFTNGSQVTLGLGDVVAQGETGCLLDVTASTLLDSARIGGILGPNLSATHFTVEDRAITNNSTVGSGGETEPVPPQNFRRQAEFP